MALRILVGFLQLQSVIFSTPDGVWAVSNLHSLAGQRYSDGLGSSCRHSLWPEVNC